MSGPAILTTTCGETYIETGSRWVRIEPAVWWINGLTVATVWRPWWLRWLP